MPVVEIGMKVYEMLRKNKFKEWAIKAWMIWSNYCHQTHDNEEAIKHISQAKVEDLLYGYKIAQQLSNSYSGGTFKIGDRKWIPSPNGVFRADVDARFNETCNSFGVGVVVRNHKGEMIAALAKAIPKPTNILEAEIVAAGCYGMGLCLQEVKMPFLLYLDSVAAVHEIKNADGSSLFLPDDMVEVLNQARESYFIDVFHMFHEANSVAHYLAHVGANCSEMVIWTKDFPTHSVDLAYRDSH